ncbi:MAG: hypothetical protein V7L04_32920 [Nostoc sp.]|uniref:hypothetical protein n=1 Tax=Nostoc sp. TaxID=1180 RepID=UPI002FFA3870
MSDYTLVLEIDSASLNIIKAAQLNITIAKPVSTSTPNVTWLVFDPFQQNTVEWTEQYGIYASPSSVLTNGAVISRLSEVFPAHDAAYYTFTSSATFSGPNTGAGAPSTGTFQVNNDMPNTSYSALTFGLEQAASINGTGIQASPLNAAVVPAAFSATFTPLTTVYVWLQANLQSGTVITQVISKAAIVTFGGSVTKQVLKYNPATGTFVPTGPSGNLLSFDELDHVKLFKPSGVH